MKSKIRCMYVDGKRETTALQFLNLARSTPKQHPRAPRPLTSWSGWEDLAGCSSDIWTLNQPGFNFFNFIKLIKPVYEAMMARLQRRLIVPLAFLLAIGFYYTSSVHSPIPALNWQYESALAPGVLDDPDYFWRKLPAHYPPQTIRPLPAGKPWKLPKIQHQFSRETSAEKEERLRKQRAVHEAFGRGWKAYREHAWLQDELAPVSGGSKNTFGGWSVPAISHRHSSSSATMPLAICRLADSAQGCHLGRQPGHAVDYEHAHRV